MSDVEDYLPRTRRLAASLVGRRLSAVVRLLDIPSDDDPRLDWGPLLLELGSDAPLLADVDEAKANLLLFDLPADRDELERSLANTPVRSPVVGTAGGHRLSPLLSERIEHVEEISREPDPTWQGAFELSGLRLTLSDGFRALVGTHLTSHPQPGVWLLAPDEADSTLRYAPVKHPARASSPGAR